MSPGGAGASLGARDSAAVNPSGVVGGVSRAASAILNAPAPALLAFAMMPEDRRGVNAGRSWVCECDMTAQPDREEEEEEGEGRANGRVDKKGERSLGAPPVPVGRV